ncbi:hypothetical protein ILUMI_22792 [Ignelater luminosus]|uniref:Uncharacterized protein n=1 Tax=Ignelater luminosus TaxID=2038154 RepID=A0A8K0G2H3_IGNLU|nr:hypothetical protein ILUMI_22792 [Ignelater luminosus]
MEYVSIMVVYIGSIYFYYQISHVMQKLPNSCYKLGLRWFDHIVYRNFTEENIKNKKKLLKKLRSKRNNNMNHYRNEVIRKGKEERDEMDGTLIMKIAKLKKSIRS